MTGINVHICKMYILRDFLSLLLHTVGGIKTVTFPFHSVPSKRNASSAVCRSITCTPPLHFRSVSVPFRLGLAARDRASDR